MKKHYMSVFCLRILSIKCYFIMESLVNAGFVLRFVFYHFRIKKIQTNSCLDFTE